MPDNVVRRGRLVRHGSIAERDHDVPLLERFDDENAPPVTPKEIKQRWVNFHRQVRLMSGTRLQRTAGRILGEDTWRYATARFIFRPAIQLLRRARKSVKPTVVTKAAASKTAEIFPVNYRPLRVDYALALLDMPYDADDVHVVVIDETDAQPVDIVSMINTELNETSAEWLFLADSSFSTDMIRFAVATLLTQASPRDDVVFGDEDGPNEYSPILKSPAVGPHTLLSYNVVGRPALLRVETLFGAGGFSAEAGWAYEHDAYLRLNERGAHFRHVAKVLPGGRPPADFEAARLNDDTCRVVQRALERRGWAGVATPGPLGGLVRWRLEIPTPAPSIDIIIPTRDRIDLVRQCITSIEEKTTYPNYNVIILDNDSVQEESLAYFATTAYTVVPCPGPFNYAKIVNRGVEHSRADYVVTLNNDTVVVTPDWLEQMLALAALPDVGIVGACIHDPDGHHEHEGIVVAPYPQHLRTDTNYPHVDHFSLATRDVAAVTGAVQMVERSFWESLGGMDEQLKVVMNDVDICFRSQMQDRYVVYTPDARLLHHVGSSRGKLDPIDDRNRFLRRWGIFASFRDPYFPASLLLLGEKMFYFPR
jgi:GT2 family glycosyltransferase